MISGTIVVDWRGETVKRGLGVAIRKGMNKNLARAVRRVKPRTPVLTGLLQGSMRMEPVREMGPGAYVGYFGSFDVEYAIHVELGTVLQQPRLMITETADETFPELPNDIRSQLLF